MKQKIKNKKFELITYLHLIIIILFWISPFWLDWKLVIIGILLYYTQLAIVGNCILTKMEFKENKREMTVYSLLLEKIGFKFKRKNIGFAADYVFPYVILGIALIWQVLLTNGDIFEI